jgi:hypothetical protein
MRKLWIRRRGVETVIGGLIVLVLLLMSLVAMVVLTRQYDVYQSFAAGMQLRDTERYSENLQVVYPGLDPMAQLGNESCSGEWCNAYSVVVTNLGISVQIARIYVTSIEPPGCTTPCVINPSPTNNATPFTFKASSGLINQGEFSHEVVFWLPWNKTTGSTGEITLPRQCTVGKVSVDYGCNSITLVTTRGRQFSFQWPLSPTGESPTGKAAGGTGIYIGPLVYIFQRGLVSYTTPSKLTPQIPIGGTPFGYWTIPSGTTNPLIIYVKLQTDVNVTHDVYLTDQSVLELARFTNPGNPRWFFIAAPITVQLCTQFAARDQQGDIICNPSYGYDITNSTGNNGNPNNLVYYRPCPVTNPSNYNNQSCTGRYRIPAPTYAQRVAGARGKPVIVAFSTVCPVDASGKCVGGGGASAQFIPSAWTHVSVTTYLGLTYVWNDAQDGETGYPYVYGVTLPFVAMCIDSCPS